MKWSDSRIRGNRTYHFLSFSPFPSGILLISGDARFGVKKSHAGIIFRTKIEDAHVYRCLFILFTGDFGTGIKYFERVSISCQPKVCHCTLSRFGNWFHTLVTEKFINNTMRRLSRLRMRDTKTNWIVSSGYTFDQRSRISELSFSSFPFKNHFLARHAFLALEPGKWRASNISDLDQGVFIIYRAFVS